jgi:hypothetical protein
VTLIAVIVNTFDLFRKRLWAQTLFKTDTVHDDPQDALSSGSKAN